MTTLDLFIFFLITSYGAEFRQALLSALGAALIITSPVFVYGIRVIERWELLRCRRHDHRRCS